MSDLPLFERIRQRTISLPSETESLRTLDDDSIARAEEILRCKLPPLLRDLYRKIGNGRFGPGHGLLPLLESPESTDEESVVALFTAFSTEDPEDPSWEWPAKLVPFCDWGCAIRSCVDCSSPEAPVVTFDPNGHAIGEDPSHCLAPTHLSLDAWFQDWLEGVDIWNLMFEPDPARSKMGINPFTKQPLEFKATKLRRVRG